MFVCVCVCVCLCVCKYTVMFGIATFFLKEKLPRLHLFDQKYIKTLVL